MASAIPTTQDLEKAVTLSRELADLEASLETKTSEFEKSIAEDREAIQAKAAELSKLLGQSAPARGRSNGSAKADEGQVFDAVPKGEAKAVSSAEVAEKLGTVTGNVSSVLKSLEDDGRLKSTGERRGKRYYR